MCNVYVHWCGIRFCAYLFVSPFLDVSVMRNIKKVVPAAVSGLLIGRLLCINFKELEMYNSWLLGGFCKSPSCVQLLIWLT